MPAIQTSPLSNDFPDRSQFRFDADEINARLRASDASSTLSWAGDVFGDGLVLTTSFGIQSAVMLHLATQLKPDIPVVWVDTGYLPDETYQFVEQLTNRLDLNLRTYHGAMSPREMEERHGRLWESDDVADLDLYDQIRKVEPLQRALAELQPTAWLSGLRRDQTGFRKTLDPLSYDGFRFKLLPILEWSSRDVFEYLERHELPYHPLFYQGYSTVGDWHSSRPRTSDDTDDRQTRFGGRKEECGIHLPTAPLIAA